MLVLLISTHVQAMTTKSHLSLAGCKMHLDFRVVKMQDLEWWNTVFWYFIKLDTFKEVVGQHVSIRRFSSEYILKNHLLKIQVLCYKGIHLVCTTFGAKPKKIGRKKITCLHSLSEILLLIFYTDFISQLLFQTYMF